MGLYLERVVIAGGVISDVGEVAQTQVGTQKVLREWFAGNGGILVLGQEIRARSDPVQVVALLQMPAERAGVGDVQQGAETDVPLHAQTEAHHVRHFTGLGDGIHWTGEAGLPGSKQVIHVSPVAGGRQFKRGILGERQHQTHRIPIVGDAESAAHGCLAVPKWIVGKAETRAILRTPAIE